LFEFSGGTTKAADDRPNGRNDFATNGHASTQSGNECQKNSPQQHPQQGIAAIDTLLQFALGALVELGKELVNRLHDPRFVSMVFRTMHQARGQGLIGRPRLNGEPHWAFPVQNPVMQVGFHARPVAITAGRPKWTYRPSTKQDGASTPALPYVLGAQEFPTACLVVITEGQWDAIAWAAAIGWLRPGQPWPPGVTVFGIPGGTNWGSLRKHWTPLWPKAAEFLLIPDADEAGRAWKTGFAAQLRPHALNLKVWALPDGQDFSDFYQAQPLSCAEMADLIECLGLTAIIS